MNFFTKAIAVVLFLGTVSQSFLTQAQVTIPSFGEGITLEAKDGSAKMDFGFRVQSLFTMEAPGGGGDMQYAMMVRRSRIKSDGYLMNEKFGYKFELGLSNRDIGNGGEETETGNSPRLLYDAVFKYKPSKSWEFWFGQTKLPGNRERVISSQKLQFVDRSMVNADFNIDRDFGVWIFHKRNINDMPLIFVAAITNGEGRDIVTDNTGGFSYTGRVEFLPLGTFTGKGDYFSADLARESTPKISFALSYNYNDGASRQSGQLGHFVSDSNGLFTTNLSNLIADMIFKYKGWSVMSEYARRTASADFSMAGPLSSYFDLGSGFNFQTGYVFKNNYEIAARYTQIMAAEKYTNIRSRQQYTLGVSKYFMEHTLKWQTDISYTSVNGISDPAIMYRFQFEFGI